MLKEHGLKDGIMNRAYRNTPLTMWQRIRNLLISKKRYIVERVFGTLKRHYDLGRTCYLGTAKVQGELMLASIAYNTNVGYFYSLYRISASFG